MHLQYIRRPIRRGRGMTEVKIFAIYSQFLGEFTANFKDLYSLAYSPMYESSFDNRPTCIVYANIILSPL